MNTKLIAKFATMLTDDAAPRVRDPRLLMDEEGQVRIYYAPFEYINPAAKVVLVGITPGPTQMANANNEARRGLLAGQGVTDILRSAKETASFSGEPMRGNLIKQLNHWGVHKWLKLSDSSELFSIASHLLHSTSLLRYPVFVNGEDYRGTPDMTRHPLLRRYLLANFVEETHVLSNALFISLGPKVQQVFSQLVQGGLIDERKTAAGMLHPSGNCTYRVNYLVGERTRPVPHATNPVPYDLGRAAFRNRFSLAT